MTVVPPLHGDDYLRSQLLDELWALNQTWEKTDTLVRLMIEQLPWWVPPWAKGDLSDKWEDCRGKGTDALKQWEHDCQRGGLAYTLRGAARRWRGVTASVSEQPGTISTGQLESDDVFSGKAADAYRESVVPSQRAAMEAITEHYTGALSQALDDAADAADSFDLAQCVATALFLAACIGADATLVAGKGAAEAIAVAIVAILLAAAAAVGAIVLANDELNSRADSIRSTLLEMLSNWDDFENHAWPKAAWPS